MDIHGEKVERAEVSLGNRSAKGRDITLRPLLFLSLPLFTQVRRNRNSAKLANTECSEEDLARFALVHLRS